MLSVFTTASVVAVPLLKFLGPCLGTLGASAICAPASMCLSCAQSCGVRAHAYRNQGVISVGTLQELSTF